MRVKNKREWWEKCTYKKKAFIVLARKPDCSRNKQHKGVWERPIGQRAQKKSELNPKAVSAGGKAGTALKGWAKPRGFYSFTTIPWKHSQHNEPTPDTPRCVFQRKGLLNTHRCSPHSLVTPHRWSSSVQVSLHCSLSLLQFPPLQFAPQGHSPHFLPHHSLEFVLSWWFGVWDKKQ